MSSLSLFNSRRFALLITLLVFQFVSGTRADFNNDNGNDNDNNDNNDHDGNWDTAHIVGVVIGAVVLLLLIVTGLIFGRRRRGSIYEAGPVYRRRFGGGFVDPVQYPPPPDVPAYAPQPAYNPGKESV
ncbi:hypothetical protein B0H11DRAFT_1979466 [Mycena galericulata]|nr:hypothetical protein B0H11DRAFT_1979466 [Mycena galericulata]